jgi:hypothetical protein
MATTLLVPANKQQRHYSKKQKQFIGKLLTGEP